MLALVRSVCFWLLCSFCCFGQGQTTLEASEEIKFVCEFASPFFWLNEKGEEMGINADIVKNLKKKYQINATIEPMPWARAFQETQQKPNVVLLALFRNQQREEQFQWLGKIHQAELSLVGLSSNTTLNIDSLEDAKAFRVATIRGYSAEKLLREKGFVENRNLVLVSDTRRLWQMLYEERVDFVISDIKTDKVIVKSFGMNPEKMEAKLILHEHKLDLYAGTGKLTSREIVLTLQMALQAMEENGELQSIMRKWGVAD